MCPEFVGVSQGPVILTSDGGDREAGGVWSRDVVADLDELLLADQGVCLPRADSSGGDHPVANAHAADRGAHGLDDRDALEATDGGGLGELRGVGGREGGREVRV